MVPEILPVVECVLLDLVGMLAKCERGGCYG